MKGGPRRLATAGAGLVLIVTSWWWVSDADVRRVDGACDTWLHHRDALRAVVSETDEAVGRARAADAARAGGYFNDLDRTRTAITAWHERSPEVVSSLDDSDEASGLERGAVSTLGFIDEGLVELERLIETARPSDVAVWLPEVAGRFQILDDICLTAARS